MSEAEAQVIEAAKEFTRAWIESESDHNFHDKLAELEEKLVEVTKPLLESASHVASPPP